ncbi:PAS domain S-box/urea ABC transporter, urea binding protein [Allocoleopsis franciscana PCC 7113]|uniref:Adenylate cyclase n=2 Tax=Allocoleopsis TaxID=2886347 RepID=K9WLA8_9CYAN|nr:PAS domain S-box/urea ABC transporter, urea binding protein [Allocoleopsis franciscana PCC 7113]
MRVGILHSLSGTMAISEAPLVDAALMAIAEINQTGGVLGQDIEPVIEDAASDSNLFAVKARKLIQCDRVATIFGGWTSESRKAVLPVVEELNGLLWYPVQYEGLECSKNIFYTGSCPNQQIEPAVTWLLSHKGKRFYLLGSNSVFPRTANKIIKAQLKQQEGTVVGEEYVSLGESNFTEIVSRIQQAQPDVVFNTLNGDSNIAFYRQYQASGITSDQIPILTISIAEAELQRIGEAAAGHYACWSYFQSLDTPRNRQFVENFQQRYGSDRVTSAPIEAAYTQVYLWKQAVEQAQSFEVEWVRVAAYGQSFEAPGGLIRIEPNHHVTRACHIGKILPTGQFNMIDIDSCNCPIQPLPWLGLEPGNLNFPEAAIKMLSDVSQEIHETWELEQKYRELEATNVQLQREITQRQNVELVLRDSEAQLHALLTAITDVVLVLDMQGRYLKIAPTNLALLHKPPDELIGKTLHEVFSKAQADMFLCRIQESLETQQTFNIEYSHPTREKKEVWFAASISPLDNNSVIWVARDMTERKQAEEARRSAETRYRSIFENTYEGLFQMTPDGCLLSANPGLARIYGYESAEELRAAVICLNQQRYVDKSRWDIFLERMQTDERVSDFESQVYRQDGEVIWISENAHVVRDPQGELLYYEGSVVDITKRKVWEEALRYQQECTEELLLNILPSPIAQRLKRAESTIADNFADVTVLFADLVNFTEISAEIPPTRLVDLLNKIFSEFDHLAEKHSLEKIKTIGDAYMVVGGLPTTRPDHAEAIAEMALDMQQKITRFKGLNGEPFRLRIGINTGPVIAGVIGTKKFTYDLWGDTVNVASRMESHGVAGCIQVTDTTYERLRDKYVFEERGLTSIKGKGDMITYWLMGRKDS